MKHEDFIKRAKSEVVRYESIRPEISRDVSEKLNIKDVFVVWSCKTLQNSKALMSMAHKGALYYEFTLNGDKGKMYMDAYKKELNRAIEV